MSRLRKYIEQHVIHFITSATHERKPKFEDRWAKEFLLASLRYHKFVLLYKVYGYVIMPDHLHLLIQPHDDFTLSRVMNHIKGEFARLHNRVKKIDEPFWQKRYCNEVIKEPSKMFEIIDYIHNNPVKSGLVTNPEDYVFSSFRHYIGREKEPLIDKIE